mmetsp:Transcript_30507/g.86226  ORF Transcript_30507/g.86226 Transcript_30507/m.86226 type:complete len:366 (+) Transcript_30507:398-1495(+)
MASQARRNDTAQLTLVAVVLLTALPSAHAGLVESARRALLQCRIDGCGITCGPIRPECERGGSSTTPTLPAKPQVPPPQVPPPQDPPAQVPPPNDSRSCFGNLPFGLENCVCDGAEIGEMAGIAACGRVATQCEQFVPFSNLESVQRICDQFAVDACISAAQNALLNNPGCGKFFNEGGTSCTGSEAKKTFQDAVNDFCMPLCPDCPRLEEKDYPGQVPQPPPPKPQVPAPAPAVPGSGKPKCTDSLEFQLEQCICDGDITGASVGRSACDKIRRDCIPNDVLAPFSLAPTLEEIQQVCDDLTRATCLDKAEERMDAECKELVTKGGQKCTAGQALQKFLEATEYGCQAVGCAGCGTSPSQNLPF